MATVAKTTYAPDVSGIADGAQIDASDVTTPLTNLRDYARAGRLAASGTDTTLGTLTEKLLVGTGLTKTLGSGGGDETLTLTPDFPNLCYDITAVAGENLAARDYVALDPFTSGKAIKMDADYATNPVKAGYVRGFALAAANTDAAVTVRIMGPVTGFTSLSTNTYYWLSATAGGITPTKLTVADGGAQILQCCVGWAYSATVIIAMPHFPLVWMKRATLANTGSLTITHLYDYNQYQRDVFVLAYNGSSFWERCTTGRVSGGTRDVVVRYDDGAAGTQDSNTTFINSSGGSLDLLCGVRQQP